MIPRSKLNTRLIVQRKVADDALDGAGADEWVPVRTVWAEVLDDLPSRAERQDGGFTSAVWRARVRMDRRSDITAAMRFVGRDRIMEIVSGPALVENPRCVEFMVEEYNGAGRRA
ncbi:head-tail adaptor protein [Sphingomonas sp. KR1UV-12]|uniref:Head-tail adaptor protein n=1 Tax=Sphingomonas aurea TaxID=3063994 RepID=A0ABT9EHE3_9SPHN|nr:head-tail adaptor protein [Sphingomonas sp. KR1UV-12]MDP1026391.1 head-tail adaptor protein [Sphingomonas sp. KR1UV-12]